MTDAQPPVALATGSPGQSAFLESIKRVLGFHLTHETAPTLSAGRPLLVQGWWPHYLDLIRKYPGQIWTVWHSGWMGSDMMGEGKHLEQALRFLRAGKLGVFWLERRDVLPEGARHLSPVWSPGLMAALLPEIDRPAKMDRSVSVALTGGSTICAKNVLASLVACIDADAQLHIASSIGNDPDRGNVIWQLLGKADYIAHPMMAQRAAMKLVSSCLVHVHVSITETWPYQPMEAIYSGTPAIITPMVPWASRLSPAIRRRCVLETPKDTSTLARLVRDMLDSPRIRDSVLAAQRRVLDELAPACATEAVNAFRRAGFNAEEPQWA